jgi:NTP pyrophosphatase (non-canonical NTP hydrolase)
MDMWDYFDEPEKEASGIMGMVQEFARTTGQKPTTTMSAHLIDEEYEEWSEECTRYHRYVWGYQPKEELKELADLLYVVYGYANTRGWDLDEAVRRVHENNMGRMYQPDGSIKRREDGKILKNKDYPKVELGDLV